MISFRKLTFLKLIIMAANFLKQFLIFCIIRTTTFTYPQISKLT